MSCLQETGLLPIPPDPFRAPLSSPLCIAPGIPQLDKSRSLSSEILLQDPKDSVGVGSNKTICPQAGSGTSTDETSTSRVRPDVKFEDVELNSLLLFKHFLEVSEETLGVNGLQIPGSFKPLEI